MGLVYTAAGRVNKPISSAFTTKMTLAFGARQLNLLLPFAKTGLLCFGQLVVATRAAIVLFKLVAQLVFG